MEGKVIAEKKKFVSLEQRRQNEALGNLGEDLKQWRKLRRLTRAQLSRKSGVSESTIARLERGESGVSVGTLVKLVRKLKIPEFLDSASPFESDEGRRLLTSYAKLW